jgi:hypothetical protein
MPASTSAVEPVRHDGRVVVTGPVLPDDEPGIASLLTRALEDARGLAAAEIALYKARFAERLTAYRGAITFFAIAGVLALAALIALLVGLILSLATLIGPGLATAAVVICVFAIAGVLALIGKRRLAPPALDPAP